MTDGVNIIMDTDVVVADYDYLTRKLRNKQPLWKWVSRYLSKVTRKMFKSHPEKNTVRGVRWPKPSPEYKLKKFKDPKAISSHPMKYTGALLRSIRTLKKKPEYMDYGTKKKSPDGFPYAAYHNQSKRKGGGKRPFLFLQKDVDDKKLAEIAIKKWIER